MPKVTKREQKTVFQAKTTDRASMRVGQKWWQAQSQKDMCEQIIDTASFLRTQQEYRYRQASIYSRLYGNQPLSQFAGTSGKIQNNNQALPIDRPTMNVVQSCIDTLVSRITQSRPRPVFLTDNGDYKERKLAKQMNTFINGEFYQTDAYALKALQLRDAAVFGTGVIKTYRSDDNRIALERKLHTQYYADPNDAYYGKPRQLYEFGLVDRDVLKEFYPEYKTAINRAEAGYPDDSPDAGRTVADQIMVVEAWHLPSSKESNDGMHAIACSSGLIFKKEYKKTRFPVNFLHYSPRPLGLWGQGLAEQLMGTQAQINELLITISRSINIVGVPRVFVEMGSKVGKATLNNLVGAIVPYSGTMPSYQVAPCVAPEIYAQLERLIQFAYQQSGISALAATAQKPAGLNSGEAIRNYDDLQSDRFAALVKRYDDNAVELAYQFCEEGRDIVKETGSYQTIYPNKNGTKEIELKEVDHLDNPFVIQCFDASSLPRDPSGRLEKVTEMMQAGLVSPSEGRRLLDFPDIEQVDKLETAAEERILKILDEIVEEGKYTPPDPFMDLVLANKICVQYYNLYMAIKLSEDRAQKLRNFFTQVQSIVQAAQPPPMAPGVAPQAVPQAPPVSPMLPNAPGGSA